MHNKDINNKDKSCCKYKTQVCRTECGRKGRQEASITTVIVMGEVLIEKIWIEFESFVRVAFGQSFEQSLALANQLGAEQVEVQVTGIAIADCLSKV